MKILITGGTGLIGTEISKLLLTEEHEVVYLSRKPGRNKLGIMEYGWDPDKGTLDERAWEGVTAVINLAGAPLNKRWTASYKSEILRSRVDSTRLLFNSAQKHAIRLNAFVSASAVNYYPHSYERLYTEDAAPGSDFLSMVCQKWEQEAQNFEQLDIRTVRCRIGIVLSRKGGALAEIIKPAKFGLGAPLGNGKQWQSWIHIEDVARAFVEVLEDDTYQGPVNVVAPTPVSNRELSRLTAEALSKPHFVPAVPALALKLALGEMATIVLASAKADNAVLREHDFSYRHAHLKEALQNLLQ